MPSTEPPWVNSLFTPVSPDLLLENAALQFLHAWLHAPQDEHYPTDRKGNLTYRYLPRKFWSHALGLSRHATEKLLTRLLEQNLILRQQLQTHDWQQGYSYALTDLGHQRLLKSTDPGAGSHPQESSSRPPGQGA